MPRRKPVPTQPEAQVASVTFADGTTVSPNGTDPAVAPKPAAEPKTRVGFYMLGSEADEARAAYVWTRPHTGIRSFSDFISDAVHDKVHGLRRLHNDGQPFTPVAAGELPTGRPVEV